jgi:hypothetical protein
VRADVALHARGIYGARMARTQGGGWPLKLPVRRLALTFDSTVISRSGQGPKAALALTAVILGGTITMAGSFVLNQFAPFAQIVVAMAGAILAICGLLVGCFMIRCPSCKKRWVTDWIRRQSAGSWMSPW